MVVPWNALSFAFDAYFLYWSMSIAQCGDYVHP